MALEVIDRHTQLYDGDVVRLHFTVTGFTYLTAAQVAAIEEKVKNDPRFSIIRHSIPKKDGLFKLKDFTVDCKVNTPGVTGSWIVSSAVATGAVTAAVIAKVIMGAIVVSVVMLTLVLVERVVETAGETAEKSEGFVQAIPPVLIAAIAGYIVLKVLK